MCIRDRDMNMQMFSHAVDLFKMDQIATNPMAVMKQLDSIMVAGYQIMGRLEDVPLTTDFAPKAGQSCACFDDLFGLAYQSGSIGYCFGENSDHSPTTPIPDAATRKQMADAGQEVIEELVRRFNMPHVVEQMRKLEGYCLDNEQKYPWMPSAWNKAHSM